jgi:hypothetical protein
MKYIAALVLSTLLVAVTLSGMAVGAPSPTAIALRCIGWSPATGLAISHDVFINGTQAVVDGQQYHVVVVSLTAYALESTQYVTPFTFTIDRINGGYSFLKRNSVEGDWSRDNDPGCQVR